MFRSAFCTELLYSTQLDLDYNKGINSRRYLFYHLFLKIQQVKNLSITLHINPLHSHKKLVEKLSRVLPSDGVYQSINTEPPIGPYFSHVVTRPIQTNRVAIGSQSQGYLAGGSYQLGGIQPTASYHEHLQPQGHLGWESYQS